LNGVGGAAAKFCEIEDAGGGERVEGAAGVGHGDGDDGGEEKAGETLWHFADEEERENAIGALAWGEERGVLRENEEQDADQEKNCELDEDDDAAGEEGAAAVFFIARGEESLDDGLVRAVGGHG